RVHVGLTLRRSPDCKPGLPRGQSLCYIPSTFLSREGLMFRTFLAAIVMLTLTLPTFGQMPWQFKWQKGLVLTYKIKHTTAVVEVVDGATNTSSSALDLVNRWQVTELDDKGVA